MNTDAATPPGDDLAQRFIESASDIITVDGHEVRAVFEIDIAPGDLLEITRLTASRQRPQAIKFGVPTGDLVVSSTRARSISLWNTTAPRKVRVRAEVDEPTTVEVWNAWRFGGLDHAWIGNAGMVASTEGRRATLQCSDGIGKVDFTDLVVTIEHLPG